MIDHLLLLSAQTLSTTNWSFKDKTVNAGTLTKSEEQNQISIIKYQRTFTILKSSCIFLKGNDQRLFSGESF